MLELKRELEFGSTLEFELELVPEAEPHLMFCKLELEVGLELDLGLDGKLEIGPRLKLGLEPETELHPRHAFYRRA